MKLKRLIMGVLVLLAGQNVLAQDQKMNAFIDQLMAKMTVEEKLGQMNLLPGTSATTGELKDSPLLTLIEQGKLGTVLNQTGVESIRQLQDAAKRSRLGIPVLVGMDVIHGYETIFPIPLGMSCSWNLEAIEQAARIAAKEATADGICWTYSPMVDIALDARWGRIAEGNGEDPFLGSRIAEALVKGHQDVQPVLPALRGSRQGRSRFGDDLIQHRGLHSRYGQQMAYRRRAAQAMGMERLRGD